MGGGGTTQTTQVASSAPSNPDVNPTISKLLQGVQSAYDTNPKGSFFDKSLYAGLGSTSTNALSDMLSGAQNPQYSQAFGNTFSDMASTAAGNRLGEKDPGYAALRSNLINDVTTNDLSAFNNSGLFGSDSNRKSLSQGLGTALGGLDMQQYNQSLQRQQQAQQGLAGAYQNTFLPAQTAMQVGQIQDTDRAAALQGQYDQFTRGANAQTDQLAKLSSILAGNAAAGGTTTTNTQTSPQAPWWQTALGYVAGNAGQAMRFL